MKARVEDNVIIEVLTPIPGFSVEQCFHPLLLEKAIDVPDDLQVGDTYIPDSGP